MLGKDGKMIAEHAAKAKKEGQREKQNAMLAEVDSKRVQALEPNGDKNKTVLEAQIGRMMHGSEFRKKLLKLNGYLRFIPSRNYPQRVGIYIVQQGWNLNDPDPMQRGLRFLTGMEKDLCPEKDQFSSREEKYWNEEKDCEDTRDIFDRVEIRGWRSVLAMLLHLEVFTKSEMVKMFPETSLSENSASWNIAIN